MKLGETSDSIHAISFMVQEGYSTPENPYRKAVKILRAIDGTIIKVFDYGARESRTARFNLNWMGRANYYLLGTYLEAHAGQKIRIELENPGERVFGEQFTDTVFYAFLVASTPNGESEFEPGHSYYSYSLELDYAGLTSTAVPNILNSSQYDFLFDIDCLQPTFTASTLGGLPGSPTAKGGDKGLVTTGNKVYFFNPLPNTAPGSTHTTGPGWDYKYSLPADNAAQGLKAGVFNWSLFADISADSTGIGGVAYKAGMIREGSFQPARYRVDARQGGAVEKPEGFSFAARNDLQFQMYSVENNLSFFGALVRSWAYDRLNGQKVLLRTGINNQNSFDYANFKFQIEPRTFNSNISFPVDRVNKDTYPYPADNMVGKPVLATYGRFEKGLVQTVSFHMSPVTFPNGKKYLEFLAWDGTNLLLTLDLDVAQLNPILGYAYATYPADPTRFLYIQIYDQVNQSETKTLHKAILIDASSGKARFKLQKAFKDPIDATARLVVFLSNIRIIIDNQKCLGMRKSGYLLEGVATDETAPLQLFGKEGEDVHAIVDHVFKVIEDGNENQITVDTDFISLQEDGQLVIGDQVELPQIRPELIHDIVGRTSTDGYPYFDFGFSVQGVESNEITVRPIERITFWVQPPPANSTVRSARFSGAVIGAVYAIFSRTSTTVLWTPFYGATGYRITRLIPHLKVNAGSHSATPETIIDVSFGLAGTIELSTGGTLSAVNGVVEVTGGDSFLIIDHSVVENTSFPYQYSVEPIVNGQTQPAIISNSGINRQVRSGVNVLGGIGKNESVVLVWQIPDEQQAFTIKQDNLPLIGANPFVSSSRGWYEVTGLDNNQPYKFTVSLSSMSIGSGGDNWFVVAGEQAVKPTAAWFLLKLGQAFVNYTFYSTLDQQNSDLSDEGWKRSWGLRIARYANDGLDLPPAAVVFTMLWKIDKEKLQDLSDAKDVRILFDMVFRSYRSDDNQPVKIMVQLRGLYADKSPAFTIGHPNDGSGLECKRPTETGSYGAYARFQNLPGSKNGTGLNTNYETEASSSNVDGLYTGKDLWRLSDDLFANGAALWSKVEYLMIAVTNAELVPHSHVNGRSKGYSLGVGGPPDKKWGVVKVHKPALYLEYVREFDGGLKEPLYMRIDGGRVDDGSGTFTGTPGALIEKARHVTDHIVYSMVGYKPYYIGTEMKDRENWLWRYQAKESKNLPDMFALLAKNLHAAFTISPDDRVTVRSLNVLDSANAPVYDFTDSNIIEDSIGMPDLRQKNEIYQKLLVKFNLEPSADGKPTESMLMGFDMATGTAVSGGYATVGEDDKGNVPLDGYDGLETLCEISTHLYAANGQITEYGTSEDNPVLAEMFYRYTKKGIKTGLPIDAPLPNMKNDPTALSPKDSMKAYYRMLLKYLVFDAWYFPLSCSMDLLIYNSTVQGKKDEAGTVDHKLKMVDVVTVKSQLTKGQKIKGLILDIEPHFYDGFAALHVFCPVPPGQFGPFLDNVWDAGAAGPRDEADYLFKGNLYGLLGGEDGTFADAGAAGAREENNMKFPDGSFADPMGNGSGKA